jgi:hypothetical protein
VLVCAPARAQDSAPDALIRRITTDLLSAIRHDKALQAGNGAALESVAEAAIEPHADFRRAAQTAVGAAWRNATPQQQNRLTVEFRRPLLRTYSHLLAAYESAAIQVLPARVEAGDDELMALSPRWRRRTAAERSSSGTAHAGPLARFPCGCRRNRGATVAKRRAWMLAADAPF